MTAEPRGAVTPRRTPTSPTTSCHPSTTRPQSHEASPVSPAAHNIALLVNPTAGKGRAARVVADVTARMRERGSNVAILVGTDASDAQALARQAIADGVDALVALGGDGMVHLALNVVAGTSTPLGITPAGTGNDLANTLRLPPKDPAAAAGLVVDRLTGTGPRAMDAVRVGEKWFGCV